MNSDRFNGICKQVGGKVKEHWGTLTDDPHVVAAGRHDRIAGSIQERRGICAQEADSQLAAFLSRNRNWQDI